MFDTSSLTLEHSLAYESQIRVMDFYDHAQLVDIVMLCKQQKCALEITSQNLLFSDFDINKPLILNCDVDLEEQVVLSTKSVEQLKYIAIESLYNLLMLQSSLKKGI